MFNEAETLAEPETPDLLTSDEQKKKTGVVDTFFVKVREELDIIPAKVQILEYMQEKATFKDAQGNSTIKSAEVIKNPIPKAMSSVNLMSYIVVSKYVDGLPLHRLEKIIQRYVAQHHEPHSPTG